MNRKEFGQLVAVLRLDVGWTQNELAEYTGLDEAIISNIERGARRHFEPEILFTLANALQLTSAERREFLIAASGLEQNQIVRQPNPQTPTDAFDDELIVEKLVKILEEVRLPAYLADPYGDVLAANYTILQLMGITTESLAGSENLVGGFNLMRLFFDDKLGVKQRMGADWEQVVLTTMHSIREMSLRYRVTPYFRLLMSEFQNPNKYPGFNRLWRKVKAGNEDKNNAIDVFSYRYQIRGQLSYIAVLLPHMTRFGELYLILFSPTSSETNGFFQQIIASTEPKALRLASWPNKPFIE